MKVPLYQPDLNIEDLDCLTNIFTTHKFARGYETENFEKNFAKYTSNKYAIAVNSGTAGLHLLVKALNLKENDEVITSPFSFIASSNCLLYEKIIPKFIDINPNTFNLECELIEKAVTKKTKAIVIPHIFGLPADMIRIKKIAKKHHLFIIEDACESIGKPNVNYPVAMYGDATVYSFYENKPLCTGEGGMIVTKNKKLANLCVSLRDQGRSNKKDWLSHVQLGYNYRITEIQSALGNLQLKKIIKISNLRKTIAKNYNKLLKDIEKLVLPFESKKYQRDWFIYYIILPNQELRQRVEQKFVSLGIGNQRYFVPIHLYPQYRHLGYKKGDFPITEDISERILAIPFYNQISIREQEFVANTLKSLIT